MNHQSCRCMAHQCSTVATGRKVKLSRTHKEARAIGPNNQSSELSFSISFICQINKIQNHCVFLWFVFQERDIMLLYLSLEQLLVDSYPPISIPRSYLVAEYSVLESLKGSFMLVPRPLLCFDDRKGSPKNRDDAEDSDGGEILSLCLLLNFSSSPF